MAAAGVQLLGNTNNTTAAEVEVNTKAIRAVVRPDDWGSLGIYNMGAVSGNFTLSSSNVLFPVFSWRVGAVPGLVLIKKITAGHGHTGGATTDHGGYPLQLTLCKDFKASDTGGTQVLPGSGNKLRTSMGSSFMTSANACDIRISSTAALTAGTRTKDPNPLCALGLQYPSSIAGVTMLAGAVPLFDQQEEDYPLILGLNEGFVIETMNNNTSLTTKLQVTVSWEELVAYS